MGVNLATLPIQTLHTLHQGVPDKLRIREKHVVFIISKVNMNNENIFIEKAQVLKEKEELVMQSQNLEAAIAHA